LWGVKVGPKMVMNSFGRRNFLQPTGRPEHMPKVPCIFQFGGEDLEEDTFRFSLVPLKFPISYHHVFNLLSKFSMYSPNMFSIAPHM
jgi:hypothetical protein